MCICVCICERETEQGTGSPSFKILMSVNFVTNVSVIFVLMQEVTATSRHYVDRLFDPDPQKVLQGVM